MQRVTYLLNSVSGVPADKVGQEAGEMLLNQLFHGGCVDDFLQDQVHYMTLYDIFVVVVVCLYHTDCSVDLVL